MPSLLLLTLTSRCATKSPKPSTENAGDRDESSFCRPMVDVTRAAAVIVGLGSEAVNRSRR